MMSLLKKIKADLLTARKNRATFQATALTTLVGEAEMIGKNDGNRETTDDEVLRVIEKFTKNLVASMKLYEKGSAAFDAALNEHRLLSAYLPDQLTHADLVKLIDSCVDLLGVMKEDNPQKHMGKVMAELKKDYQGRYDAGEASRLVRNALSTD
jgi:hypothetical protein